MSPCEVKGFTFYQGHLFKTGRQFKVCTNPKYLIFCSNATFQLLQINGDNLYYLLSIIVTNACTFSVCLKTDGSHIVFAAL